MEHVVDVAFYPRRFGPLPPEVGELASPQFFTKGSVIIRQGEPAPNFFYVNSGHVRSTILRADGIEKVLAFAEPGQFFAEVPFFQQCNHWYTCEAVEPTHVSAFSRETMSAIVRVCPDFVFMLMQSVAHKVWMLSNQMMSFTFDPTEVRLARIVIEILNHKPEGSFSITITHLELSALAGVSRVMVTRILNGWRSRGIVQLKKGVLHVCDLRALEHLAAFGAE